MDLHGLNLAAAVAGGAACAACAASTPAPSATPRSSPVQASVQLSGSVELRGDYTFDTTFTARATVATTPATPCSTFARGSASSGGAAAFVLPPVEVTHPRSVFVSVTLPAGYHGPGTYSSTAYPSMTGRAAVDIPVAEGSSVQTYHATDASAMTLTVTSAGAGTFTFQRWPTDESRGPFVAGYLNGVIAWQCH